MFRNYGKLQENSQMNLGGTGLGLSVSKNLIEKMGGSVSVESELGLGTVFIIEMKASYEEQEEEEKEQDEPYGFDENMLRKLTKLANDKNEARITDSFELVAKEVICDLDLKNQSFDSCLELSDCSPS